MTYQTELRDFPPEAEADIALWNAAWTRAKRDHLTAQAEGAAQ